MPLVAILLIALVGVNGDSPVFSSTTSIAVGCPDKASSCSSASRTDTVLLQKSSVLKQTDVGPEGEVNGVALPGVTLSSANGTTVAPAETSADANAANATVKGAAASGAKPLSDVLPSEATVANKTDAKATTGTVNGSTAAPSSGPCVTKHDDRVHGLFASVAPHGTPCVFGVDAADEGKHCMEENGQYGSFGWCWTTKSRDTWGSCNEHCPPSGPTAQLASNIDDVLGAIKDIAKHVVPDAAAGAATDAGEAAAGAAGASVPGVAGNASAATVDAESAAATSDAKSATTSDAKNGGDVKSAATSES